MLVDSMMSIHKIRCSCIWQVVADPSLTLKLRAFITDAARALDKAKMMRFDEKSGNFYCTELGRIASHFYLQYSSVETYNEMLRRHMNDSEVMDYDCNTYNIFSLLHLNFSFLDYICKFFIILFMEC